MQSEVTMDHCGKIIKYCEEPVVHCDCSNRVLWYNNGALWWASGILEFKNGELWWPSIVLWRHGEIFFVKVEHCDFMTHILITLVVIVMSQTNMMTYGSIVMDQHSMELSKLSFLMSQTMNHFPDKLEHFDIILEVWRDTVG